MKIINEYPPIYQALLELGMSPSPTVIFAYDNAIYNPSGRHVYDHEEAHEATHFKQQGDDPDYWWDRYMQDPYFRIEQEVEAYANQYDFLCTRIKDRNQRFKVLYDLARILSGPTYGNVISHQSALSLIKNKTKTK